jgi:hypothetical protein
MSETIAPPTAEAAPPAPPPAEMPACPVTADRLAPKDRRYVDFKGPAAGRMMAAKAIVPMQPPDLAHVLFMLTFDPDEKVRNQVVATVLDAKNAKMLTLALKEEDLDPAVLDFYGRTLEGKDDLLQLVVLNNNTADTTIAEIVKTCGTPLAETISQNQLRLLRTPEILRNLCGNPNATKATIDLACDFAIRSGVRMDEVPAMREAYVRIHGEDAPPPPPEELVTAEEVLAEQGPALTADNAPPMEEGKRLTLTQKIMKMNVAQKIKLATLGNKEARGLLLRETNKLVSMAAIRSPRITDGEVLLMAGNKTCQEEILRYIYSSREWTKNYKIKLALVKNPKVPAGVSLKFLGTLRDSEIKALASARDVPGAVQTMAKKIIDKKNAPVKVGKD